MNRASKASADSNRKVCSKCGLCKPLEEFNFRNRADGIRQYFCRECGKKLTQEHYKRNKQQYVTRSVRAKVERREYLRQVKSRPCADCGIQYPYYVMDFDHREGEKKIFEMNRIIYFSMSAIKQEVEKCDVVCSNCHRERTYRRIMQRHSKGRA